MNEGGITTRSCALATEISDLERARGLTPAELDRTRREHVSRAARLRDEALAAIDSRFGRELGELAERQDSERRDLEARLRAAHEAINESHADRTRRITTWATESLDAARKQLEESIWVAESVHEGAAQGPEERERAVLHSIEQRGELLTRLCGEAEAMLQAYGHPVPETPEAGNAQPAAGDAFETLERLVERVRSVHRSIARERFARLSSGIMPAVLIITGLGLGAAAAIGWQHGEIGTEVAYGAVGGVFTAIVLAVLMRLLARRRTQRLMRSLRRLLIDAEAASLRAAADAAALRRDEQDALRRTRDDEIRRAKATLEPAMAAIESRRSRKLAQFQEETAAALAEHEKEAKSATESLRQVQEAERLEVESRRNAEVATVTDRCDTDTAAAESAHAQALHAFRASWRSRMETAERAARSLLDRDARTPRDWAKETWETWQPPEEVRPAFRIAILPVDREAIAEDAPGSADPLLTSDLPPRIHLPIGPDLRDGGNLLIEADERGREAALDLLRTTMMRVATELPPGKARFTILDPVGLGESFAAFMHLADHDEKLVTSRIWTEPRHIEQRLTDLTEHMETVIQKYLRNEFETIEAYNRQAGEIAEPYRFLVIADFPSAFSESAAARLASIIASGARCGVHVLIACDTRASVPASADLATMRARSVRLEHDPDQRGEQAFRLVTADERRLPVRTLPPPPESLGTDLLGRVGERARRTARVEVPFSVVAPTEEEVWSLRSDETLHVPLGRAGATRLQEIVFGVGTSQHALLAGKTGSGKSTLLHVLITNVALWYPPDEVEFYLIDFKKGVEFKQYAALDIPHARAVAVESDREFGLSVLQRVDRELAERGDRFRDAGAQDLAGFRRARPGVRMPRVLLIVDEFQEMFVEDDRVGQEASLLLDRIVRQGRAFGIHVLLGSQTLGGAYSIARSTMGQIQIRIALQCSEADSYLIMSEDNAAARLLSRPGEAIYNDAGGRIEGNSPFQIVWLDEEERAERLRGLSTRSDTAARVADEPMVVFEGSAPALISRNPKLTDPATRTGHNGVLRAWIGEPVAIKGPTEVALRPQSGSHLLVVGQRDEAATAMFIASLISFAAHRGESDSDPEANPRLIILDGLPVDAPLAGRLAESAAILNLPAETPGYRDVEGLFGELDAELTRRMDESGGNDRPIVVMIHGLQRFRMLRTQEDFSFSMEPSDGPPAPDKVLSRLLREGPVHRIHLMMWCDTPANLTRTIERSALREISMRVLFQMGGNDSTSLIDTPAASLLGMHRALFFDEELGILEKFRPYAMPELPLTRDRILAK